MIQFQIQDLDNALQDRNPAWANQSNFAAIRTSAAKQALGEYYAAGQASNNPWCRSSTLSGAAITTGAADVAITSLANIYNIPLPSGQRAVADNTLLVEQSTSVFVPVPRITADQIVVGTTTSGFWENHGEINLFVTPAVMTGSTGTIHYNFYRDPSIDTSVSTNVIDIDPDDFSDFVNSVYSLMTSS